MNRSWQITALCSSLILGVTIVVASWIIARRPQVVYVKPPSGSGFVIQVYSDGSYRPVWPN